MAKLQGVPHSALYLPYTAEMFTAHVLAHALCSATLNYKWRIKSPVDEYGCVVPKAHNRLLWEFSSVSGRLYILVHLLEFTFQKVLYFIIYCIWSPVWQGLHLTLQSDYHRVSGVIHIKLLVTFDFCWEDGQACRCGWKITGVILFSVL